MASKVVCKAKWESVYYQSLKTKVSQWWLCLWSSYICCNWLEATERCFPTYLGRQLPHFNCRELKLLGIIGPRFLPDCRCLQVCHVRRLPNAALVKEITNKFQRRRPRKHIKCWLMEHILYSINTIILHKLGSSQTRMLKWLSDSYMSMSRTAIAKLIAFNLVFKFLIKCKITTSFIRTY